MRLLLALLFAVQTVFPPAPSVVRTTPKEFPVGSVLAAVPPGSTLLNDLVAYWPLDETSGTRYDSVGSNNLTDNNTVGSVINASGAMHNAAASFVAANSEYLSLNSYTFPAEFSLSFWAYPPSGADSWLVGHSGLWPRGVNLYVDDPAGTAIAVVGNADGYAQLGTATVTEDTWSHFLLTFDSNFVPTLYVNGGSAQVGAALTAVPTAGATLVFGMTQALGVYSTCKIDEVAIWSRVLTADERAELYNLGAGKFHPTFN